MNIKNFKIGTKIRGLVLISLSTTIIVSIVSIMGFGDITKHSIDQLGLNKYSSFQYELRAAVQPMAKVLSTMLKKVETEEEQIKLLRELNTDVRFFGESRGYYFIHKKGGIVISNPIKPELTGKTLIDEKDPKGRYYIKEMEKAAFNGGGIVNYFWSRPGEEGFFEKMSYALQIPGTDYWIGAGTSIAYINVVKQETEQILNATMMSTIYWASGIIFTYLLFIIIPLTILIVRTINKPIAQITAVADLAKVGDFSITVDYQAEDELGSLAEAFRAIANRQIKLASIAETIAKGDLTTTVPVESDRDNLGKSLQKMVQDLNGMVHEIFTDAETISNSSFKLKDISSQMVDSFQNMNQQTDSVSGATVQMSSNLGTMASGSEEMSSNIHSISASSTQLSQNTSEVLNSVKDISESINNVSQKSETASEIAKEANEMAGTAANIVGTLNQSAKEIGEVTDMIKEIASQTNLLALNANIEAASAGEAGKGFAVVATEIKELANQSAQAATDIGDKITHIQTETDSAVKIFEKMSEIVDTINESSSAITALTFEQTESANLVTANVQEAARGIDEIAKLIEEMASASKELSRNSSELTLGSSEISKSVSLINQDAKRSLNDTENIQSEAVGLSDISAKLEQLVKRFTLSK